MPIMIGPRDLWENIQEGQDKLEPFRDARKKALREYVGRHYGNNGDEVRPLNLVNHAISVLLPNLCPSRLEYRVRPRRLALSFEAEMLGTALTHYAREIDLIETIRKAVIDAILSPIGIIKCGLRVGDEVVKINDRYVNIGEFYCQRVDLDDWVVDPTARDWREVYWEANKVRVPRIMALESGLFPSEIIERLPNIGQDISAKEKVEELGDPDSKPGYKYDMLDIIELLDVTLFEHDGAIWNVVLPAQEDFGTDYLSVREWQGPERGPYEHIGFQYVPNNLLPAPLSGIWKDLAEALNDVATKMMRNAARAKTIFAYAHSAEDEAERAREAPDGEFIAVDDPTQINSVEMGGIHHAYVPFLDVGMQWWNMMSGNITMLAGSTQTGADTATEFQGLQANMGVRIKDMIARCDDFKRRIGEHILWEIVHDPLVRKPLPVRMPGGETIEVVYDAESREGDFWDFSLEVQPTVPVNLDPQVRARRLVEVFAQIPQWAQTEAITQGRFNFSKMVHAVAREFDMPELEEVTMDPAIAMMNEQMFAQMPQPAMGQPAGRYPGQVNVGRMIPQGASAMRGQQTTPADAAKSAGSSRIPQ